MRLVFFLSVLLTLLPQSAQAYIGPGLGMGAIGVVLGVIVSIFLAIIGILWYPLKRIYKRIKGKNKPVS